MATKKITQRVLLIPTSKLEELEIEIKTLKEIPLEQKKQMAVEDLSFFEFIDYVNENETNNVYVETMHYEWYDETPDYFFAEIGESDDSIELVLNDFAEFHIKRENKAYSVDVYKYFDQNSEHDFDLDCVWEMGYVFDDDIEDLACANEDEEDDEE